MLTVLAALDESMAEWLFDLLAEAASSCLMEDESEDSEMYGILASFELSLQANLEYPLKLKIDPETKRRF